MILAQPAVASDLEKIGPFAWIRDQNSPKKVSCVWRDIFREGQRRRGDVFIQQINVVAFRVGWVIVEG